MKRIVFYLSLFFFRFSLFFAILLTGILVSCQSEGQSPELALADSLVTADTLLASPRKQLEQVAKELTVQQRDSLRFRLTHHYTVNFNFRVKADTLLLLPRTGDMSEDTCLVTEGNLLVVADIRRAEAVADDTLQSAPPDTFYIKVAHDQQTMGWVEETLLLRSCVPDDDISQLIDWLSGSRALWMSAMLLLGILAVALAPARRNKHQSHADNKFTHLLKTLRDEWDGMLATLPSPYPLLLLILVSLVAVLYASVQLWMPEYWQEYYFHPTMNPLILPSPLSWLVGLVWLTLIVFVAVLIEVYNHLSFPQGIVWLLKLCGTAMLLYLLLSITTRFYVGYILLIALVVYFAKLIRQQN